MHITTRQIQSACTTPAGKMRIDKFIPYCQEYFEQYGIITLDDEIMWFTQGLHETSEFAYLRELGSHAYLDKYDTGRLAKALGNTPQDDDDGQKWRGRGIFQTTGLYNYTILSKETGIDFLANPEWLEQPKYAVLSACHFWKKKNIGSVSTDIVEATRKINPGLNHLDKRKDYFYRLNKACA